MRNNTIFAVLTVVLNNIVNQKTMSKKENKEQDILKAAEKLFAEKGFKGATTTLIAAPVSPMPCCTTISGRRIRYS